MVSASYLIKPPHSNKICLWKNLTDGNYFKRNATSYPLAFLLGTLWRPVYYEKTCWKGRGASPLLGFFGCWKESIVKMRGLWRKKVERFGSPFHLSIKEKQKITLKQVSTRQLGIDWATFRFHVHLEISNGVVWEARVKLPWEDCNLPPPTPRPLASDGVHMSDGCKLTSPFWRYKN